MREVRGKREGTRREVVRDEGARRVREGTERRRESAVREGTRRSEGGHKGG